MVNIGYLMSLCFHKTGVSLLDLSCIFYPQKQNYFETENGDNFAETDPVSNLDRGTLIHTNKNIIESGSNKSIAKKYVVFCTFLSVLDNIMKYLQLVIWTAEKHTTLCIAF